MLNSGRLFLILCIGLCGQLLACSPLLNQEDYDQLRKRKQLQFRLSADCPLRLNQLGLCAEFTPTEDPVPVERSTVFNLKFWKIGGSPAGPFVEPLFPPHVWLWMRMPEGSHGSRMVRITKQLDLNQFPYYQVKNVIFSMPRAWEIHLEFKTQTGEIVDDAVYQIWI